MPETARGFSGAIAEVPDGGADGGLVSPREEMPPAVERDYLKIGVREFPPHELDVGVRNQAVAGAVDDDDGASHIGKEGIEGFEFRSEGDQLPVGVSGPAREEVGDERKVSEVLDDLDSLERGVEGPREDDDPGDAIRVVRGNPRDDRAAERVPNQERPAPVPLDEEGLDRGGLIGQTRDRAPGETLAETRTVDRDGFEPRDGFNEVAREVRRVAGRPVDVDHPRVLWGAAEARVDTGIAHGGDRVLVGAQAIKLGVGGGSWRGARLGQEEYEEEEERGDGWSAHGVGRRAEDESVGTTRAGHGL